MQWQASNSLRFASLSEANLSSQDTRCLANNRSSIALGAEQSSSISASAAAFRVMRPRKRYRAALTGVSVGRKLMRRWRQALIAATLVMSAPGVFAVDAPYLFATARTQTVDGARVIDMDPGTTLRTGDGVRIEVGSDDRAYVYVFAIGASGSAVLLHPFSRRPEQALVQAESTLTIPQRGAYLPLDRHVGREIVVAVSSRTPIRDLDGLLVSAEEIVAEGRGNLVRGLADFGPAAAISFNHAPRGPAGDEPAVTPLARTVERRVLKEPQGVFGSDGQESGVLSRSGSRISAIFGDSQPDPISQSKDPFAEARVKGETSTSGGDARRALFRDEAAQTPALTLPSAPSGGLLSGFGNLFSTSPGNAESSTSSESLAGSDAEPQSQASRTPAEVVVVDESNPSAVVRAEKERARKGKTEGAQAESDGDGQAESGSGVLSGFASLFATQESSQDASTGEASQTQSETTESTSSQDQANSVAQTFAVPAERVEGRLAHRSESSAVEPSDAEPKEAESDLSSTSGGFLSRLFGGSEESESESAADNTANAVPVSREQSATARAQPAPPPTQVPAGSQPVPPEVAENTQGSTTNTSTASESSGFFSRLFSSDESEDPASSAAAEPSPSVDSQNENKQLVAATREAPTSVDRSAAPSNVESVDSASTSEPLVVSQTQNDSEASTPRRAEVLASSGSVIANLLSPGALENPDTSLSSETRVSSDSPVSEVALSPPTPAPTIPQESEQALQSSLSEAAVESEQGGFLSRIFSGNEAEPEVISTESATSESASTNTEQAVSVASTSDEASLNPQTALANATTAAANPEEEAEPTTFSRLMSLFSVASVSDSSDNEDVAAASIVAQVNGESGPAPVAQESIEVADTTPLVVETPAADEVSSTDEASSGQSTDGGLLGQLGRLLTSGGPSGTAGESLPSTVIRQAEQPQVPVQQPTPAPSFRVPALSANEKPKRLPQIGGDADSGSTPRAGGDVLGGSGSRISRLLGAEQREVPVAETTSEAPPQGPPVSSSTPEQSGVADTSRPEPLDVENSAAQAESSGVTVTAIASARAAATADTGKSDSTLAVVNSNASNPQVVTQARNSATAIASATTTAALETQTAISVKPKPELESLALTPTQAQLELDPITDGAIPRALVLIVTPSGVGSGVVVDDQGHILTNWRTVNGFRRVTVWFKAPGSGSADLSAQYTAKVVRVNRSSDLALMKLDSLPEGVQPVTLTEGTNPERGEVVYLVGHFGTSSWRYAPGRFVTFKDRHSWLTEGRYVHKAAVLRTRMGSRPASPGGAMLNGQLEMVGLNAQVAKRSPDVYAVNADSIRMFLAGELADQPGD